MNRFLITLGTVCNTVLCIYAVMLGLLNILGSAAQPWLLMFYLFFPIPFFLRRVFADIRKGSHPAMTRRSWVFATVALGFVLSIGGGGWLAVMLYNWVSSGKTLSILEYFVLALPIVVFTISSCLLMLMLRDKSE